MAAEVLDGNVVRRWLTLAADALGQARQAIDELNVFPVPDADTGTNLHRTICGAAEAVAALPPQAGPSQIWRAATTAAMRGACGNSGIIVGELLRGMADVCAAASPCDGPVLARALRNAAVSARAAVHRPAEGTVLTVADAAALAVAGQAGGPGVADVARRAATAARRALAETPARLDVLAAHGVVDAGAAGLCVLLDALCAAVGEAPPGGYAVPRPAGQHGGQATASAPRPAAARPEAGAAASSYEVTFLLQAALPQLTELRERLDSIGDSLVVCGGEPQWHVHVHVADPGAVIEASLQAGRPSRITVSCLHGAVAVRPAATGPPVTGPTAGGPPATGHRVIAQVSGPGLIGLLRQAGAVVPDESGDRAVGWPGLAGPAAEAIILQVEQLAGPAASHPAGLAAAAAHPPGWAVIELASPVQALAAMAVHDPRKHIAQDAEEMRQAAAGMRHASIIGCPGEAPRFTGAVGGVMVASGADQGSVAVAVIDRLLGPGAELVTLLAGAAAEPSLTELAAAHAGQLAPGAEVSCYDGGMSSAILLIGAE